MVIKTNVDCFSLAQVPSGYEAQKPHICHIEDAEQTENT